MADSVCGSCGRDDEELDPVRRVYVTIADDGSEEVTEVEGEEWWCASCRATFPHLEGA
jgi:hypothetical protein